VVIADRGFAGGANPALRLPLDKTSDKSVFGLKHRLQSDIERAPKRALVWTKIQPLIDQKPARLGYARVLGGGQ